MSVADLYREDWPTYEDDYFDWLEEHNKLTKCPDCGSPMNISKKGNKYCSSLCWTDVKERNYDTCYQGGE